MSFQTDLAVLIQTKLTTGTTDRIYSELAPENAVYPYAVYTFGPSFTVEEIETYTLNINAWDRHWSSTGINDFVDKLDRKLQRHYFIAGNVGYQVDRINILTLPAEGEFRGRELKYSIRVTRRTT